jgi:uncharacterized UBP type Zn finger protein
MEFNIECPRCGEVNTSAEINEFTKPYFADEIQELPNSLDDLDTFDWAGCEYVCPNCKEYFSVPNETIRRVIDERLSILVQKYQIDNSDLDLKFLYMLRRQALEALGAYD